MIKFAQRMEEEKCKYPRTMWVWTGQDYLYVNSFSIVQDYMIQVWLISQIWNPGYGRIIDMKELHTQRPKYKLYMYFSLSIRLVPYPHIVQRSNVYYFIERLILKSLITAIDWFIGPCSSISFCFIYFEILLLCG